MIPTTKQGTTNTGRVPDGGVNSTRCILRISHDPQVRQGCKSWDLRSGIGALANWAVLTLNLLELLDQESETLLCAPIGRGTEPYQKSRGERRSIYRGKEDQFEKLKKFRKLLRKAGKRTQKHGR